MVADALMANTSHFIELEREMRDLSKSNGFVAVLQGTYVGIGSLDPFNESGVMATRPLSKAESEEALARAACLARWRWALRNPLGKVA